MKYRKKPIVVEAWQVPFEPDAGLELWLGDAFETWLPSRGAVVFHVAKNGNREAEVSHGDWIIAEPDGDGFYPCVAAEFARVYEPVMETT